MEKFLIVGLIIVATFVVAGYVSRLVAECLAMRQVWGDFLYSSEYDHRNFVLWWPRAQTALNLAKADNGQPRWLILAIAITSVVMVSGVLVPQTTYAAVERGCLAVLVGAIGIYVITFAIHYWMEYVTVQRVKGLYQDSLAAPMTLRKSPRSAM